MKKLWAEFKSFAGIDYTTAICASVRRCTEASNVVDLQCTRTMPGEIGMTIRSDEIAEKKRKSAEEADQEEMRCAPQIFLDLRWAP